MKKILKSSLIKAITVTKRAAGSNRHTRAMASKAKSAVLMALGPGGHRELYNLHEFYPTIGEYRGQLNDVRSGDPFISILLPTYNTPEKFLRECIDSIVIQSYSKWELCVADDKSTDANVVKVIKEYQKSDKRIKLVERAKNGHISEATNSALQIAKGDFVALMDHDDVLWPNALYEMAQVIRSNKSVDFIYSDEDKIDGTGKVHSYPFLKPDFSPEFLESCNYITHFSCIRRSIMQEVGGFRKGYEGAQDWDLFIRIGEMTQNITHIPKLLYSWRIHEGSTASDTDAKPYVYEAQKKLLNDHLERTSRGGTVETGIITQHRTIKYSLKPDTVVKVIIFYSDNQTFERLASSMKANEPGVHYEIVCAVADPADKTITSFVKSALGLENIGFISYDPNTPNKYALVAKQYAAASLIFVEDNVVVESANWAKCLVADSQTDGVGVVGPVLLDESQRLVKSAGLGVGYGGGVVNMLEGMPFDDPHYSRGLYAKSRRNVSAINQSMFAVSNNAALALSESNDGFVDFCLGLLSDGYRHVYTPYVQVVVNELPVMSFTGGESYEDRYLNPNFDHDNSRMEVRSTL